MVLDCGSWVTCPNRERFLSRLGNAWADPDLQDGREKKSKKTVASLLRHGNVIVQGDSRPDMSTSVKKAPRQHGPPNPDYVCAFLHHVDSYLGTSEYQILSYAIHRTRRTERAATVNPSLQSAPVPHWSSGPISRNAA
ncbi:hypothetical protein BGZ94_000328, partial [Podila epigama]